MSVKKLSVKKIKTVKGGHNPNCTTSANSTGYCGGKTK
jgi:hypothetical protein